MCCCPCAPGLGRPRQKLCLFVLEQRLESLRARSELSDDLLCLVQRAVLPELYGEPPASSRGTTAGPGSYDRQKRYAHRVARGRQVFSPLDQQTQR